MAGVEAPNPGAAEPVQRQHQQPLSLILKTVPAGISKIVLKWIPGEWHLISRTGSFNNQVMSPLNVHVCVAYVRDQVTSRPGQFVTRLRPLAPRARPAAAGCPVDFPAALGVRSQ